MSTNEHTTTFWQLLNQYKIEIPIIQRDYAQGRKGKESLRKNFLNDLKTALDNPTGKKMKLDFVYGSSENGSLYPLDGQQRLTTLWLLHWYIALRAHKLEEAFKTLKNFSYETRTSSREFCESLCTSENFDHYKGDDIADFITNQTWFYSAWKHDPTVQSMLRMIGGSKDSNIADGIQKIFNCRNCFPPTHGRGDLFGEKHCVYFEEYYERLTGNYCPIVFYYLEKDFGNSDDLYIKMNARGEQLTSFENFKADLIGYISIQAEKEKASPKGQNQWKNLMDETDGIPIKMDTTWTDIFWNNKSKAYRIDDIYFAFLNRFFLNKIICQKEKDGEYSYTADSLEKDNPSFSFLYGNKGDDSNIQYNDLGLYKYLKEEIPYDFFDSLQKTLNAYYNLEWGNAFPEWVESKFEFIPKFKDDKEISTLGQKERVVFHAVCRYFENDGNKNGNKNGFDETSFKQWMRIVWNIVENSGIETISAMIGAMRLIDELSEHSHEIYAFLSNPTPQINSDFAKDQVNEEIAKAKQILGNGNLCKYHGSFKYNNWEDIIIDAEKTAFFKGSIRFLFHNEKEDVDWKYFEKKWKFATLFFGNRTIISTIELAKYCNDTQIQNVWTKFSFETTNWKFLLLQKDISEPIHRFLKGDTIRPTSTLYTDIKNLLSRINDTRVRLMDWSNMKCKNVLTSYKVCRSDPSNGWIFEVGNETRNHWNNIVWQLFSQNSLIEIHPPKAWGEKQYHCSGQVYYRGLWTNFKYVYNGKEYFFTYYGNNSIYLMNDNWEGKQLKDKSKSDDVSNTYSFTIDLNDGEKEFKTKLDKSIDAYLNVLAPTTVSAP